jgi:hypothetical protein
VKCDFCLAPDLGAISPSWVYPAAPMEIVGSPFGGSPDDWLACEACHRLIEASNINGLADRIVDMQPIHEPPGSVTDVAGGGVIAYGHRDARRRAALRNILRFMDARRGPARPHVP